MRTCSTPTVLHGWTASMVRRLGTPGTSRRTSPRSSCPWIAGDRVARHGAPDAVRGTGRGRGDGPVARPVIVRERPALVLMSAQNGWGHHACRLRWTSPSNAAGCGDRDRRGPALQPLRHRGWYALRRPRRGSSASASPTRRRGSHALAAALLGTNPIAVAAPAGRFGTFCLDMATSTVPRGRIEVAARRGWTLLVGWAIDADGNAATTADAALAGSLHPLGGEEATGGYKGYGLAMVVELLTGILVVPRSVPTSCPCSPPTRDPRTSARRSWSSTPRPSMTRRGLRIAARDTAGTACRHL